MFPQTPGAPIQGLGFGPIGPGAQRALGAYRLIPVHPCLTGGEGMPAGRIDLCWSIPKDKGADKHPARKCVPGPLGPKPSPRMGAPGV